MLRNKQSVDVGGTVQLNASILFQKIFSIHPQAEMLYLRKKAILDQALTNIGLNVDDKTILTKDQAEILEKELKNIIYSIGHLPKFVGSEKIELDDDQQNEDIDERLNRAARNFLRHLTLGSAFEGDDSVIELLIKRFLNLATEKRAELFSVARREIQNIFDRASDWIAEKNTENNALNKDDERQFQIFMHGLLAIYPFIDPKENEQVILPQKIQNQWLKVQYKFQKIDISPQTGLLSKLIEDKDRLYAYGLVPIENQHAKAQPYLLFMGTSYPTGQGETLSYLYNLYPRHSVGEAHDTTHIDAWIEKQDNKINVLGQSKGAVMSMITAARHHTKIDQAYCYNPTGLSKPTLDRLNKKWKNLKKEERPVIHVYAQAGDIVFPLENGFLEGTHIYRILPQSDKMTRLHKSLPLFLQKIYEAHIHNFAGRECVIVLNVNTNRENNSRLREFRGDMKEALNWIIFPIKGLDTFAQLWQRKVEEKLPIAKVATLPLFVIGKTLSTVSLATFLIPGVAIGGLVSASKVIGRDTFGVRSDYQLEQPNSDVVIDVNTSFVSTTKKLALMGLVTDAAANSKQEKTQVSEGDGLLDSQKLTELHSIELPDVLVTTPKRMY